HHQQPRASWADRPQTHQMNDPALGFGSRAAQPLATCGLKRPDLALGERKALRLALKLRLQFHGQRMAIPEREAAKPQPKRALDGEPYALRHQQGLYTKPMREPLALQALELPVKVPGVLFLGAWHAYHAPAAAL